MQTVSLTAFPAADKMAAVTIPVSRGVQCAVQALAAIACDARLAAPILHHIDRAAYHVTGGRWMLTTLLTGLPVAIVTTTGARSGRPRARPIMCVRLDPADRTFALIGTNFGRSHIPGWYYNLKANPRASAMVDGRQRDYLGHEAHDAEYDRFWNAAVRSYAGFRAYRTRIRGRHIPIMVMDEAR